TSIHIDKLSIGTDRVPGLDPPVTLRDLFHVESLYSAGLLDADESIDRLLDALAEAGMDRRTYVIFLSDHGEEFGEHGVFGSDNGHRQVDRGYGQAGAVRPRTRPRGTGRPASGRAASERRVVEAAGSGPSGGAETKRRRDGSPDQREPGEARLRSVTQSARA